MSCSSFFICTSSFSFRSFLWKVSITTERFWKALFNSSQFFLRPWWHDSQAYFRLISSKCAEHYMVLKNNLGVCFGRFPWLSHLSLCSFLRLWPFSFALFLSSSLRTLPSTNRLQSRNPPHCSRSFCCRLIPSFAVFPKVLNKPTGQRDNNTIIVVKSHRG